LTPEILGYAVADIISEKAIEALKQRLEMLQDAILKTRKAKKLRLMGKDDDWNEAMSSRLEGDVHYRTYLRSNNLRDGAQYDGRALF
jgi:hypothetical protein